jgi:polyvinyl alcohol dehydrogenase (cytochrome)
MRFLSLLAPWRSSSPRTRPGRRKPNPARPRPPSTRLTVEALEDRLVLSGADVVSGDPKDWPMYNHDSSGTRWNSAETRLRPDNVSGLEVLWRFPTAGAVAGTPAVVNDRVYATDTLGNVYAVTRDGQEVWHTHIDVPTIWGFKMTTSPLVTNRTVIVGDMAGRIHGLDVDDGEVRWTIHPDAHPFAAIFSSATMVGHNVAVGVSSFEEVAAALPGYPADLTFRGSLVLLDPADGRIIWQTYTVTDTEAAAGTSGSPVWSTPSYDKASNTIFVTTGNNYDGPTNGTSDAFIAFDADNGSIKWVNQRTPGDDWNFRFPESEEHPDVDFGDSPQLYKLGGRLVVGAGQKNGFFHVLDAATGEEVGPPQQFVPGSQLGGFHMDTAVADGVIYGNGNDWPNPIGDFPNINPWNGGSLHAISGDGSTELWKFETPTPNLSGVAVANGVVYMQSLFDETLYAVNAQTGALLAAVHSGGQSSGPSISRGQIYLGTGDAIGPLLTLFLPPGPGTITAIGLRDVHGPKAQGGALPASTPSGGQGRQAPAVAPGSGGAPARHAAVPSRPLKGHGSGSFVSANFDFLATGIAAHLGAFTHYGTLQLTPTDDPAVFVLSGRTTYVAANGDKLYAILAGTLNVQTGVATGTDTWDGGTGRFAHGGGSADLTAQLLPDGSFEFTLDGVLEY